MTLDRNFLDHNVKNVNIVYNVCIYVRLVLWITGTYGWTLFRYFKYSVMINKNQHYKNVYE